MCTRNRASILDVALEWLTAVEMPAEAEVELVVVDNNSEDETPSIVEKHRQSARFPVKYIVERRQGLSCARNAGIAAAGGDLVAFIDDDCFASGDWLIQIERTFRDRQELSGIGGRVDLYDQRDLPITIRTSPHPMTVSKRGSYSAILGCNMCFRRSAINYVGRFDERLGAGTHLYSSEDSDFVYRMLSADMQISYIPDIRVFHAHGRRTEDAATYLEKGYITGRGGFYCKHILAGDLAVLKRMYWEIRNLTICASSKPTGRSLRVLAVLLKGMLRYAGATIKRHVALVASC